MAVSTHVVLLDALLPLGLFCLSFKGAKAILKRTLLLSSFVVVLVLFVLFFHNNTQEAGLIMFRSGLIIFLSAILFTNTSAYALYLGFDKLKTPQKLSLQIFYFVRFSELLKEEYATIKMALHLRGFKAKTTLFSYKVIAYSIATLFIKTFYRAQNFDDALHIRGFKKPLSLSTHHESKLSLSLLALTLGYICMRSVYELFLKP